MGMQDVADTSETRYSLVNIHYKQQQVNNDREPERN